MADPVKFTPGYSFTDWQTSNPTKPLPGNKVDQDMANIETSIDEIVDAIKDVRRSDGKLANEIVTLDSLDPTVAAGVGAGALASAEAAAASADAASDSVDDAAAFATAASGYSTAASGYASTALTYRNAASGFADDSAAAATLAQTARDYANLWATAAEGVDVNDGVNPVGKSAYHWAQVALDAATGALPDNSVSTTKIVDGAVTSAKIADGTIATGDIADSAITSAKIADGTIATGDIADSAITSAKIANGTIATGDIADEAITGAKLANSAVALAKLDPAAIRLSSEGYSTPADTELATALWVDGLLSTRKIASGGSAVTLSGASFDITGMPVAKRYVFSCRGLQLSGSDTFLFRLGTSAGFVATGYTGAAMTAGNATSPSVVSASTAAQIGATTSSSYVYRGKITLELVDTATNLWTIIFDGHRTDTAAKVNCSFDVALPGVLDRVQFKSGGTNTLAGTVSYTYE